MTMYFSINTPSNLITDVISTSYTPTDSKLTKFILVNDKSLTAYYKYCKKNPGLLMDIGELMSKSPHVNDQVKKGRTGTATPKTQRLRDDPVCKHVSREDQIAHWIDQHPSATPWDLDFEFCLGITAAKAYMSKYGL